MKHARPNRPRLIDAQEGAILVILLVQAKEENAERELSRALLSEMTLKRLWGRRRLRGEFIQEVQEWLFRSGWALFDAGATYALVRTRTVEGWPRLSSKRLQKELRMISEGGFDFSSHYSLLTDQSLDEEEE